MGNPSGVLHCGRSLADVDVELEDDIISIADWQSVPFRIEQR